MPQLAQVRHGNTEQRRFSRRDALCRTELGIIPRWHLCLLGWFRALDVDWRRIGVHTANPEWLWVLHNVVYHSNLILQGPFRHTDGPENDPDIAIVHKAEPHSLQRFIVGEPHTCARVVEA